MMKAVLHIDQMEKWKLVLDNAGNMLRYVKDAKEPYEFEVLANAAAIRGLLKSVSEWERAIRDLQSQNVGFKVCNHSMLKFGIRKEDLYDGVDVVPAGVIELIQKQQEGFAYIKP